MKYAAGRLMRGALLAIALLAACGSGFAATLLPNGMQQFTDGTGVPYAGGTVTFFIPSTTTPKTTFTDSSLGTPNTNPVILDGNGRAAIWGLGPYRQILKDSSGNLVWDVVTSSWPDSISLPIQTTLSGTNTLTATLASGIQTTGLTAYATGMTVVGLAAGTNTAAVTLNALGLGAKNVFQDTASGPLALAGGEITANNWVQFVYDTTLNAGVGGWHLFVTATSGITLHQQSFIASGTFTSPANTLSTTTFKFTVVGGGGGGAAANPTGGAGGGGGAGATAIYYATGLTPSQAITVTVGGGGGSSASGTASSIVVGATTVTAGPGVGAAASGSGAAPLGGAGGTATNGTINIFGGSGSAGNRYDAVVLPSGGSGAASSQGGGGGGGSAGNNGIAAGAFGSGGGGAGGDAGVSHNGGGGAGGFVLVEYVR